MTGYVVLDEGGLVRVAGNCRILPEGALAVVVVGRKPWVPAPGQIGLETAMSIAGLACAMRAQAGGYLVARPASPVPVADGDSVSIPPCPAGTRIEVFDLTGREVMGVIIAEDDGQAETLTFPDPGEYEVEVEAPAPALPSSTRIMIA